MLQKKQYNCALEKTSCRLFKNTGFLATSADWQMFRYCWKDARHKTLLIILVNYTYEYCDRKLTNSFGEFERPNGAGNMYIYIWNSCLWLDLRVNFSQKRRFVSLPGRINENLIIHFFCCWCGKLSTIRVAAYQII